MYQPTHDVLQSLGFHTKDEAIDLRFRFYQRLLPASGGNWIGLHAKPGVHTITEFDRRNLPVATYEVGSDKDIMHVVAGRGNRVALPLD